ncbi:hypothetical protein SLS62_001709 [Diatrype stigma]|uniref:FAD-binding PCMH-type domain-containing protein n=1 Tax=Diatrype stigma TaxID=117547 RepID=A0AAN9UZA9_9PEZI
MQVYDLVTLIDRILRRVTDASLGQRNVASPGSTEYKASLESYYSVQQRSMQPACIVSPQSVEDVSTAVKALARLREEDEQASRFAIRSGGHSSWAGASNIEGGSVIDLRSLNTVELSTDKSRVSVGVGATWGEVYEALEPHGLAANGGRAYQVGKS